MDNPELIDHPKDPAYDVQHASVPREPYFWENVFYRATASIGYPVELREYTTKRGNDIPNPMVAVMVRDTETVHKLLRVQSEYFKFNTHRLFTSVSPPAPSLIQALMREDTSFHPNLYAGVEIIKPLDERILEECFMRSFEILHERSGENSPRVSGSTQKLYKELQEKGVRPITPEALQILTAQDLKEIIEHNPELAP